MNTKKQWKLIWEVSDAPIFEMGHGTIFSDKKQKELFGYSTKGQILFGKNENLSSYHTVADLEEASQFGLEFYTKNKNWKKFLSGIKEVQKKIKILENKVDKTFSGKNIDKEVLGKLLLEVSDAQVFAFCHFNLTNPNFTSELEKELRKFLEEIPVESVDQILGLLTTPEKVSSLQIETLEFYKILKKNWKDIKKGSLKLENDIKKHSQKYQYLGGNEGNDKWDVEYYTVLMKQIVGKKSFDIHKEIKKIESYSQRVRTEKNLICKKYHITGSPKDISDVLGEIGYERLELRIAWSSLFRMSRRIVYKISNILEVPAYDLLVGDPQELYSWFVEGKKLSQKEILNRRRAYIFVLGENKIQSKFGNNAIALKQKLVPDKDLSNTSQLEGRPAYPGKVTGEAFVFNWNDPNFNKQISNMPDGTILIAGQTRPSLMPAIRKASAIVTDEGGITSHAAIVSRELKVPCVIGTEHATKVFKTGDIVEVDAEKGIVRLIK
jgi:phosphohistidine swiveling domain-containing protein